MGYFGGNSGGGSGGDMSALDWANGSGSANANKVDNARHADDASAASAGFSVTGNIVTSGGVTATGSVKGSYITALDGVIAGPYTIYYSQAAVTVSTVQPDVLNVNDYTGGVATFTIINATLRRQYQFFNRNGTLRIAPSSNGVKLPGGATSSYIQSSQAGAYAQVWVDNAGQTWLKNAVGVWLDAAGNQIVY